METLNFGQYVGTWSLDEAKKIAKLMETDILEAEKKQAIITTEEKHGTGYTYEVRKGTRVDLTKLKRGQEVCACMVKGHHMLMTKKYHQQ